MRKEVDGCVGCGQLPCYHCKETINVCDWCGTEEVEDLYQVEGDEVCEECFDEHLNELKADAKIKE